MCYLGVVGVAKQESTPTPTPTPTQTLTPTLSPTATPVPVKSLTLISPNGGEKWVVGNTYDIKWEFSGVDYVYINYVDYSGGVRNARWIVDRIPASLRKYSWRITENLSGNYFKIYLFAYGSQPTPIARDESDNYFSIVAPSSPITVLSPNGGEVWTIGQTKRVSWSAANVSYVRIYIYDESIAGSGSTNYIYDGAIPASTGYYDWTILKNQLPGLTFPRTYKIRIDGVNSPEIGAQQVVTDRSDNSFTIKEPTASSITVLSPNGEERWEIGKTYEVRWRAVGVEKVDINVMNMEINKGIAATGVSALLGKYSFEIRSQDDQPGNKHKVHISAETERLPTGGYVEDWSDNYFSIVSAPTPSLTLISPNGGEKWEKGKTYDITWTSSGIQQVGIYLEEFELEGGIFPTRCPIDASCTYTYCEPSCNTKRLALHVPASDGKYSWTVPDTLTQIPVTKAKILIEASGVFPKVSDESDNYFSAYVGAYATPTPMPSPTSSPTPTPAATSTPGVLSVTFTYKGNSVTYGTVLSQGKLWLDRNLGATQVATAYNDAKSFPMGEIG